MELEHSPPALPLALGHGYASCPEKAAEENQSKIGYFVTASAIESDPSQLAQEQLDQEFSFTRIHADNAFDVSVNSLYPFELNDHNPTETERHIYGINAITRARHRWLRHAADVICSGNQPEIAQASRDHAQSQGLHGELAREVLIHRIEKSSTHVQRTLAQHLVLLVLILIEDHGSDDVQTYIESDQTELLESLVFSLRNPGPPKRPNLDEDQITSLTQALLELSGGEVDRRQHVFAKNYTAVENADLYASIIGIKRTKQFGDFNLELLCNSVSKSSVFSEMTINVRNVKIWTTRMRDLLPLGFPDGYLNLPLQVLNGFGFVEVDMFNVYLANIYQIFPSLQKPENSMLMLLAYSSNLATQSTFDCGRQLEVLQKWANSEDGWSLHKNLVRDAQAVQSAEQLSLITIALMSYSRLLPDHQDHFEQPINSSFLADLDAHFRGDSLGNGGRVAEQMVFALIRVLSTLGDQHEDLITFLVTALDRDPPLLHPLAGLSDQYLRCRIDDKTHGAAFDITMGELPYLRSEALLQHFQHLQVGVTHTVEESYATRTANDIVPSRIATAFSPAEKRCITPLCLKANQHRLARLSDVEYEDVSKFFDIQTRTWYGVLCVLHLGDGSYEIAVQNSNCTILKDRLDKMLPESNFDLEYDPIEPTHADLQLWDYDTAKELHRHWFILRARRVAENGESMAAAYYAHRLKDQYGLDAAVTGSCLTSFDGLLVPTFRGYLESEDEAICLVEACLRGTAVHSSRGPRVGEATFSGNVFVWEASSAGIGHWSDGMEWATLGREQSGFEVFESVDAPGLMKKTISIPVCKTVHHVVSYFTAEDVPSLARPSWCMIFMP